MGNPAVRNAARVMNVRQQLRHSVVQGNTAARVQRAAQLVLLVTSARRPQQKHQQSVWQARTLRQDRQDVLIVILGTNVPMTAWKYRTLVRRGNIQNRVKQQLVMTVLQVKL